MRTNQQDALLIIALVLTTTLTTFRESPAQEENPETPAPAGDHETPTELVLFAAQRIKDARRQVSVLLEVASSQDAAGDKEQALATLKLAERVAGDIENAHRKAFVLCNVASAQIDAGDKEQALLTLKHALELTQGNKDSKRIDSLRGSLVSVLAKAGDFQQAFDLIQQIQSPTEKVYGLTDIASAQALLGESEKASATLKRGIEEAQRIEKASSELYARNEIALAQLKVGDTNGAESTLKRSMELVQQIDDPVRKLVGSRAISLTLARAGKIEQALAAIQHVDEGTQTFFTGEIASILAKAGLKEQALKTFRRAVYLAHRVESTSDDNAYPHSLIASYLLELGEIDQALIALEKAFASAKPLRNSWRKTNYFNRIATGYAKAGEIERAMDVIRQMEDVIFQKSALFEIALTLATEPTPDSKDITSRQMKNTFTPQERRSAQQIVKAIQGK